MRAAVRLRAEGPSLLAPCAWGIAAGRGPAPRLPLVCLRLPPAQGRRRGRAGPGSPLPHLHRDRAHPCHIRTGTGLTRQPHPHRDWAHPSPHLPRDWAHPCPHPHRDWAHPCPHLPRGCRRRAVGVVVRTSREGPRPIRARCGTLAIAGSACLHGAGTRIAALSIDPPVCRGDPVCRGRGLAPERCPERPATPVFALAPLRRDVMRLLGVDVMRPFGVDVMRPFGVDVMS